MYPTKFIVANVDCVRCVSLTPTVPETMRLTAEWMFPAETLAQPGFSAAEAAKIATTVMLQDGEAAELNQRGLKSPKFTRGRLMPQEFEFHRFHQTIGLSVRDMPQSDSLAACHCGGADFASRRQKERPRSTSRLPGKPMTNLEVSNVFDAAECSIRILMGDIDRYLAGLPGPGIDEVRTGIAGARAQAVMPQLIGPQPNGVVSAHLAATLKPLAVTHPSLAKAIAAAAPALPWFTYDASPLDEIGEDFAANHAFTSIIGNTAAVPVADYSLGLFLIAPHVVYRDHNHPAPELYAPLTGPHGWRFEPNTALTVKPAHQPVWNEPNRPHLIKAGPVSFLSIYAWTRDVSKPARVLAADDWAELEAVRIETDPHLQK